MHGIRLNHAAVIATALLLAALAAPPPALWAQTGGEKICIVETREYSGGDPSVWQGIYAAKSGIIYSALCTEPGSAHFYDYDPERGTNRMICELSELLGEWGEGIRPSAKVHNHPVEDNEGNIYFVSMSNGAGPDEIEYRSWRGGYWLRYDPRADRVEPLEMVDKAIGLYPFCIDPERKHLFGVGYTGYFYRYDIEKDESVNLGRVATWDICRDIAADDRGNVYGCWGTTRMFKYEAATGRVVDLELRLPYDPTVYPTQLKNPQIDRAAIWRAVEWDPVDRAIYGVTCGSGSILFKYEPHVGPEGRFTTLGRLCDPRFLTPPNRKDIPYSTMAFALDSRNRRIYYIPSSREYTLDDYVETFGNRRDHHLLVYDMNSGEISDLGILRTGDGRRVFGCEAADVADDGTVYFVGQAEVNDPSKATRTIVDTPVALQMVIYRPNQR